MYIMCCNKRKEKCSFVAMSLIFCAAAETKKIDEEL